MKLSDYIIDFLVENGITHVFEVIGGAISHIMDSFYDRQDIKAVTMHHEQAAAFAAEGYSRITGNFGVALATSGPGATNLITGIGSSYFDSIPCIYITGQVNTYEYKFDKPIRQLGFQETDIVSMVKPITKYAEMITDPQMIKYTLQKALFMAKTGRPGPILVDIPLNIQRANIKIDELESFYSSKDQSQMVKSNSKNYSTQNLLEIANLIKKSKRPIILIGGGARLSKSTDLIYNFVKKFNIPVVCSLNGLDAFPHDDSLFFGMIGAYGNRYSNLAIANCDLVICFGSRLDARQTGTQKSYFAREARIIRVDIDESELSMPIKSNPSDEILINADLKGFLTDLCKKVKKEDVSPRDKWLRYLNHWRQKYPSSNPPKNPQNINPHTFLSKLSHDIPNIKIICVDTGQNQMWAAQSFVIKKDQRLLTDGGMGAMGFALPTAIGAAMALGKSKVLVIVGDGGMQINIQELNTIVRNSLPIKIIVLNNKSLGMVRQFQTLYFRNRLQSTVKGYTPPDFVKISEAYKIKSFKLTKYNEYDEVIPKFLNYDGPSLLEVTIETEIDSFPKLVVNYPIEDQYPFIDYGELKSEMIIEPIERLQKNFLNIANKERKS